MNQTVQITVPAQYEPIVKLLIELPTQCLMSIEQFIRFLMYQIQYKQPLFYIPRFETTDIFTPEEVVAMIKATPPNPQAIRPATGSLAEALKNSAHDPNFDVEQWNKEWAMIETEMKATTRANSLAERQI